MWIDPNETSEVALANSSKPGAQTVGKNIKKLFKDGLIMKRKVHMHSKWRVKQYKESKRRGERGFQNRASPGHWKEKRNS